MINVFVSGGLGNQMFQYAAARALADQLGVIVCIDKSLLNVHSKNMTPRDYELDSFFLKQHEKITSSKQKGFLFHKVYPRIKNTYFGNKIAMHYNLYVEKDTFNFDPDFLSLHDNTFLLGYFQSEKYFTSFQKTIRECFVFRKHLLEKNEEITKKIRSTNAVSIHIRRGDYISDKKSAGIYASISSEYYENAINKIREQIENPVFFVFSDDPDEAKKIIQFPGTVYIDWNNGQDSYIDMQLMSLCKHNVIANSSFSWWGAWLNQNKEKLVIAPRDWFKDEKQNNLTRDLIPETWTRI